MSGKIHLKNTMLTLRAEQLRLAVAASHHPGGHLSASIGVEASA